MNENGHIWTLSKKYSLACTVQDAYGLPMLKGPRDTLSEGIFPPFTSKVSIILSPFLFLCYTNVIFFVGLSDFQSTGVVGHPVEELQKQVLWKDPPTSATKPLNIPLPSPLPPSTSTLQYNPNNVFDMKMQSAVRKQHIFSYR